MVRVQDRDGSPWFVAADVCRILGVTNPTMAVQPLDEDERSTLSSTEGGPDRIIVSEGGLYTIILRSRDATKPGTVAHRFRKWVTGEVLPTLRRTGRYDMPVVGGADGQDDPAGLPIGTKITLVNCVRHAFGERAAQQMTFKVALPVVPAMEEALRQHPDLFQAGMAPPPGSVTVTVTPSVPNGGTH